MENFCVVHFVLQRFKMKSHLTKCSYLKSVCDVTRNIVSFINNDLSQAFVASVPSCRRHWSKTNSCHARRYFANQLCTYVLLERSLVCASAQELVAIPPEILVMINDTLNRQELYYLINNKKNDKVPIRLMGQTE